MPDSAHYTLRDKRVWVAGHNGMVGSALVRRLAQEGCAIVAAPRNQVDLRRAEAVETWLSGTRPQAIFLTAARVGGIQANGTRPAEFIYDNLMIEANVIHSACKFDVEKPVFLGSSCIYPKLAPQPIPENALLTGPLEPTNEWYAVAKIAGIKLCQAYRRQHGRNFISAMPTNLYGPGDNFDLASSHVIPALIAKAYRAKFTRAPALEIWGTGTPMREFLYVDDAADALVHLMKHYSGESHVNVGTGTDISIARLAELICVTVGFEGRLRYDHTKPDGTPRKLLDVSMLTRLGWRARTPLSEGLRRTCQWYAENQATARAREPVEARAGPEGHYYGSFG